MYDFNISDIITRLIVFIIAGSIHEYSHAIAAYRCGDPTAKYQGRMTINPSSHIDFIGTILFPLMSVGIGWMKPVPVNYNNLKNQSLNIAFISFAGPFSNFIQAVFVITIIRIFSLDPVTFNLLGQFALINILLMGFNLIPMQPLDGGGIMRHFLPYRLKIKYDYFSKYSFIILIAIIFLPSLIGFPNIINLWLNPFFELFHFMIYSEFYNILIMNIINVICIIYFFLPYIKKYIINK